MRAEQQTERRRDRLQELVDQCEDEELMDVVLPRLTKVLSVWELLLAKVERGGAARSQFPDIYREFESLQAQVRQAAQDYIISPQGGASPLEVRNIEVARSLGILDEVNKMKVVPGASPVSSVSNKNVRYMENTKMLPPSKRFKMENSVPVHQNGVETPKKVTPVTSVTLKSAVTSSLKSCSVPVSPLVIPAASRLSTTTTSSSSSSSSPAFAKAPLTSAPPPDTPMEVAAAATGDQENSLQVSQDQVPSSSNVPDQMNELENFLGSSPDPATDTQTQTQSGSTQTPQVSSAQDLPPPSQPQQSDPDPAPSGAKELQEGQEIYIQTEGLTVQLAEPGSDRIVIVNGPDGTTMHIQTPEGVPLEAVQALLGIEAAEGSKALQ